MLRKLHFFLVIALMLNACLLSAENIYNRAGIKISDVIVCDSTLIFKVEIVNTGKESLILYKPTIDDFCSGILYANLINTETAVKHVFFPCNTTDQLSAIFLSNTNSIYLEKDEGFSKYFKISLRDIIPHISKGKYILKLVYSTSEIVFESDLKNILRRVLFSNEVIVQF